MSPERLAICCAFSEAALKSCAFSDSLSPSTQVSASDAWALRSLAENSAAAPTPPITPKRTIMIPTTMNGVLLRFLGGTDGPPAGRPYAGRPSWTLRAAPYPGCLAWDWGWQEDPPLYEVEPYAWPPCRG